MGYSTKQIVKFDAPKTFAYRANIDDLTKYARRLLYDPELCRTMGEAGRQHVVENLDYRVTARKMLDKIKEVLNVH